MGRKWANVDKGTYLPRNDSLSIPDDLLGEMQSFAKQYEPIIYYISLFEEFKEDLEDLDIKNANQMKWLFDRQDHCFEHLRGYIRKKGAGITAVEYLDLILFDIEGIFTIEDIRKYLSHLPEFTFLNAISKTDSIMSLGDGKYVNCQDCFNGGELSPLFRETLKNEIKIALAKSLNSQVSVPALYGRFITIYPHLQKKLKKLDSPRGFAVAIKSICKRKYSISWPFLTPHGVESVSSIGFIVDYVRSKKSVTADEINSYALINGVRQIGFIDLFEMVSENYVMLEKGKLFSKDVVAIDQAKIDKARTELQFYLRSFGDIDSEQFRGFSSLPMIGFKWDVVSLLGFVMSYCKDTIEYQIYKKDYRLPIYKLRIKRR